MQKEIPLITEFVSAFRARNYVNFKMESSGRSSAAYIFLIKGKIRFSQKGNIVIADARHPVYIPDNAIYINECLEEADSIVFNLKDTFQGEKIRSLKPIEEVRLVRIYNRVSVLKAMMTEAAQAEIFSLLYRIVSESAEWETNREQTLITPALELIELRFHDPDLNLEEMASECHVSKVYLNKLFKEAVGMSPFRYLTRVRMEHARYLLCEKYSVGETARNVGYSDIYQFSRAYKRHFGVAPGKLQSHICHNF